MKGMKLGSEPQVRKVPPPQRGNGTPFMAEHLEEALTGGSGARPHSRDTDMSAFNKLVSSMKASGTLPTHPKTNTNNVSVFNITHILFIYVDPGLHWIANNIAHAAMEWVTVDTNPILCDAACKLFKHNLNNPLFQNYINRLE